MALTLRGFHVSMEPLTGILNFMSQIHDVAPLAELPESEGFLFRSGPHQIAIFKRGEAVHALDNVCPHAGASLAHGYCDEKTVVCPWHCWEFEIATGKCLTVSDCDVEMYPLTIEDGMVRIQLPE